MSELVKEITDSSFETDVLQCNNRWSISGRPGVLHVENLALLSRQSPRSTRMSRVVKLNVDDNVSISQRYGIKGIPTLILPRRKGSGARST